MVVIQRRVNTQNTFKDLLNYPVLRPSFAFHKDVMYRDVKHEPWPGINQHLNQTDAWANPGPPANQPRPQEIAICLENSTTGRDPSGVDHLQSSTQKMQWEQRI